MNNSIRIPKEMFMNNDSQLAGRVFSVPTANRIPGPTWAEHEVLKDRIAVLEDRLESITKSLAARGLGLYD